jgi:hypothetical protein
MFTELGFLLLIPFMAAMTIIYGLLFDMNYSLFPMLNEFCERLRVKKNFLFSSASSSRKFEFKKKADKRQF